MLSLLEHLSAAMPNVERKVSSHQSCKYHVDPRSGCGYKEIKLWPLGMTKLCAYRYGTPYQTRKQKKEVFEFFSPG